MSLKKINSYIICILISLFFLIAEIGLSKETKKEVVQEILNESSKKTEFSATFLQSNGQTIEEGLLGIKNNRLRIEYISPSKIIIILAEDKAMYYNKDLEELEYFNPQKTQAKIFFDIFFEENFFEDSVYSEKEKVLEIKKSISLKDGENIKEFKKSNAYVAHWNRLLFESVQFFGETMNDNQRFYTGMNDLIVFDGFIQWFHCPLSTTTHQLIANNFAQNNSTRLVIFLIISLKNCWKSL